MSVLVCQGVVCRPGGRQGLTGVSLAVDPGEIVGLVGPAGSGKSLLLQVLAGDLEPSGGVAAVNGGSPRSVRSRCVVGFVRSPPLIPPEVTAVEWLGYVAAHTALGPADRTRRVQWALEIAGMGPLATHRVAGYGESAVRRLALAAAAITGRDALLLDDPLAGADPVTDAAIRECIARLAQEGRAVVLASNALGSIERVATRVVVLWNGSLAADVRMATLIRERVAELSLNGSGLRFAADLLDRYEGAYRTGDGVAIPLCGGLSIEAVLSTCRACRIAVAGSRVRYRMLDDIFVVADKHAPTVGLGPR
ncbi:MAG TPA: ATP-binding cassette domain-containing protein [Gemmatimonadales bacterium]